MSDTSATPTRTTERIEFLSDIITSAVEGGTGYWAQVSHYQYISSDGDVKVCVRDSQEPTRLEAFAVLHELNDDDDGYKDEKIIVDIDFIERGIEKIREPGFGLNTEGRKAILHADIDNDAGDIDADGADAIIQAAAFGKLVYG